MQQTAAMFRLHLIGRSESQPEVRNKPGWSRQPLHLSNACKGDRRVQINYTSVLHSNCAGGHQVSDLAWFSDSAAQSSPGHHFSRSDQKRSATDALTTGGRIRYEALMLRSLPVPTARRSGSSPRNDALNRFVVNLATTGPFGSGYLLGGKSRRARGFSF